MAKPTLRTPASQLLQTRFPLPFTARATARSASRSARQSAPRPGFSTRASAQSAAQRSRASTYVTCANAARWYRASSSRRLGEGWIIAVSAEQLGTELAYALHLHYIALDMENQVTFRLPREVARVLARRARERGVPKSQLVREALETYLAAPVAESGPMETRQRIAPFIGAVTLDAGAIERDAIARQIRQHNWRP